MNITDINTASGTIRLVCRQEWGAVPPVNPLDEFGSVLARYVIVDQSLTESGGLCDQTEDCCRQLRALQQEHIYDNGFDDIGYSWIIGNDGLVYEGRGTKWRGATAKRWNTAAYGISFLGEFDADNERCQSAIQSARLLMSYLVAEGKLRPDFTVYGLRQIRPFDTPHDPLFNEIKKWPEWKEYSTTPVSSGDTSTAESASSNTDNASSSSSSQASAVAAEADEQQCAIQQEEPNEAP